MIHGGRTDSKGGHKDNINGGYHYHHGEIAHNHYGGKCELVTYTEKPAENVEKAPIDVVWDGKHYDYFANFIIISVLLMFGVGSLFSIFFRDNLKIKEFLNSLYYYGYIMFIGGALFGLVFSIIGFFFI
ncbi:hypothetical protein N9J47_01205 [Flavobacteriaceae bacterium]|nr:hypothetical protein [Flavobacteriaceae bacterium]|tara:strand:+ start:1263 stop:1649 length:387 start_codon:yes stop_codon:yes gene_type:complete